MRLLATLLCASAVSSAPVPPGLLTKALEVKNWVKAGVRRCCFSSETGIIADYPAWPRAPLVLLRKRTYC